MSLKPHTSIGLAIAFAMGTVLSTGPVLADKGGKGQDRGEQREDRDHGEKGNKHNGKHKDKDKDKDKDRDRDRDSRVERFGDPHRTYVRDYYTTQYQSGHCPKGLAKKNNGCMPPGQAKKWEMGRPLPHDVRYYDVPASLVIQLGQPAPGYRYVRVDDNILLLATGTRMVVDAIRGLGR